MDRAPQLCELRISFQPLDDKIALVAELRIGCAEFDEADPPFVVHLKQLVLDFDVSGFDILPGTRLGDPVMPNEVQVKTIEKVESQSAATAKGSVAFSLGLTGPKGDLTGGMDGNVANKISKSREVSEDSQFLRVRALGGDRWRVSEPDGARLDGPIWTD